MQQELELEGPLDPQRKIQLQTEIQVLSMNLDLLGVNTIADYNLERATTKTPVRIGDVKEPVVVLIDHGSEINLMSMDFYKKGNWPINTKHGWKIRCREENRPREELELQGVETGSTHTRAPRSI